MQLPFHLPSQGKIFNPAALFFFFFKHDGYSFPKKAPMLLLRTVQSRNTKNFKIITETLLQFLYSLYTS